MENGIIVLILALFTLLTAVGFGIMSKRKTEQRLAKENAEKSTLAADKESSGKPADV